jgi:hypothetical protein
MMDLERLVIIEALRQYGKTRDDSKLPDRRPFGRFPESPSQAEEIPNRTEPNAQQDEGNHLQFESME